jgi:hypothetical protein
MAALHTSRHRRRSARARDRGVHSWQRGNFVDESAETKLNKVTYLKLCGCDNHCDLPVYICWSFASNSKTF